MTTPSSERFAIDDETGIKLVELRMGRKYRAFSRRNSKAAYRLEADDHGQWSCQCEAYFFRGDCGHLQALKRWRPGLIHRIAPAPYDPEEERDYRTWKDRQ